MADDLESFLLVMLWVAVSYDPGTMTPKERAELLQIFDDANSRLKRLLIIGGKEEVENCNLASPHLEHLLVRLMHGFAARYRARARLDPSSTK